MDWQRSKAWDLLLCLCSSKPTMLVQINFAIPGRLWQSTESIRFCFFTLANNMSIHNHTSAYKVSRLE